jgi:hypothetical protein
VSSRVLLRRADRLRRLWDVFARPSGGKGDRLPPVEPLTVTIAAAPPDELLDSYGSVVRGRSLVCHVRLLSSSWELSYREGVPAEFGRVTDAAGSPLGRVYPPCCLGQVRFLLDTGQEWHAWEWAGTWKKALCRSVTTPRDPAATADLA